MPLYDDVRKVLVKDMLFDMLLTADKAKRLQMQLYRDRLGELLETPTFNKPISGGF